MTPAIRTIDLGKRYGPVTALEGVELSVGRGEIYGFLGRNGAGKTTTIRLLLGMIRPTTGHAEVLGVTVGPGGTGPWDRVGHLVESATAYPELTVRENLEVARLLHGVTERDGVGRAIQLLGLEPFADRRARGLSTGNLQRLALARALMHEPQLVILDEPTVGLDPAGVVEIRALLRALARDRGATVFMSSHIVAEVERVASRIGVLHEGRLVTELSAAELEARRRRRLEVGVRDAAAAAMVLRSAGFSPVEDRGTGDGILFLEHERAIAAPEDVARVLVEGGAPPTRLAVVREDMESLFLRLTGEAS